MKTTNLLFVVGLGLTACADPTALPNTPAFPATASFRCRMTVSQCALIAGHAQIGAATRADVQAPPDPAQAAIGAGAEADPIDPSTL